MSGLFDILEIGSKGLYTAQTAIEVTGHNIANANTEGFSRQRVIIVEGSPITTIPGQLGTGVMVQSITRFRDEFLDYQIRVQSASYGFYTKTSEFYDRLELVFSDSLDPLGSSSSENTSTGLNSILGQFFDAFQDLSLEPESSANRSLVLEQAITTAENFQTMKNQLTQLQSDLNEEIVDTIEVINDLTRKIAAFNGQIARAEVDDRINANDLRDQRDAAVTELSELIDIKVVEEDSGEINISFNGINIVDGVSTQPLTTIARDGDSNYLVDILYDRERSRTLTEFIEGGELGALLKARDETLIGYMDDLDEMAKNLMSQVNLIHSQNMGLTGFSEITGYTEIADSSLVLSFYNEDYLNVPTAGSFDIRVLDDEGELIGIYTVEVDPTVDSLDDLADRIDGIDGVVNGGEFHARVGANGQLIIEGEGLNTIQFQGDTSGVLAALGVNTFFNGTDASNMAVNSNLLDNPDLVAASGDGTPGNNEGAAGIATLINSKFMDDGTATIQDFYTGVVSVLGIEYRRAGQQASSYTSIRDSLVSQQEQLAGVNLDEESVNLIKFQQAYNAAAKVITVVDELLDKIINGM